MPRVRGVESSVPIPKFVPCCRAGAWSLRANSHPVSPDSCGHVTNRVKLFPDDECGPRVGSRHSLARWPGARTSTSVSMRHPAQVHDALPTAGEADVLPARHAWRVQAWLSDGHRGHVVGQPQGRERVVYELQPGTKSRPVDVSAVSRLDARHVRATPAAFRGYGPNVLQRAKARPGASQAGRGRSRGASTCQAPRGSRATRGSASSSRAMSRSRAHQGLVQPNTASRARGLTARPCRMGGTLARPQPAQVKRGARPWRGSLPCSVSVDRRE